MGLITLDLETSIHNKGNPFDVRNFIVSAHIKREALPTSCSFYTDPDFLGNIKAAMADASLIVGCNIKFDLHHLGNLGIRPNSRARIWDVMVAEFILSGQTNSFASLNSLAELYGLGAKEDVVASYWERNISTENIPRDIVESYGNHDVDLTHLVYLKQLDDPRNSPELTKLIRLCGLDLLVLQDMEWNGFLYDTAGSVQRAATLTKELEEINAELSTYAAKPVNFDSGDQLSIFLYGGQLEEVVYNEELTQYKSGAKKGQTYIKRTYRGTTVSQFPQLFKPLRGSEVAKSTPEHPLYSTAEDILQKLKATTKSAKAVIALLRRRSFLAKLVGTYLTPWPKLIEDMHWKDNLIHGQFNQVVARTGRLSSSAPNMQNAPEEVDEFFVTRFAS